MIRRRSSPRSSAAVRQEQVVADAEPVIQEYFLHRLEMDDAEADSAAREELRRVFAAALTRRPEGETDEEEESDESTESSRLSPVAGNSGQASDPNLTRMIARELASLGDRFALQQRFRGQFDATFKLMEERAAMEGGDSSSLFTVFREAVRRLLTNQPVTWGTLVTLFEFAYFVMRRFVEKLICEMREAFGKVVSRVRQLASAIVRYVRTVETGIVDWLVGEGGWRAALDLEADQRPALAGHVQPPALPESPASSSDVASTSSEATASSSEQQSNANRNSLRSWFTLGAVLALGAAILMASHSGSSK